MPIRYWRRHSFKRALAHFAATSFCATAGYLGAGCGDSGNDMALPPPGGSGGTSMVTSDSAPSSVDAPGPSQPEPAETGSQATAEDSAAGSSMEEDSGAAPSVEVDSGGSANRDSGPSPIPDTTEGILAAKSANCLLCAQMNGCLDPVQTGGTCEMVAGDVVSGGLTRAALCRKTLSDILTSQCDATLVLEQCLCGTTETDACLAGLETPTGAAYQDYVIELGTNVNAILVDFETQAFGVGQANTIARCVGYVGCGCLGD